MGVARLECQLRRLVSQTLTYSSGITGLFAGSPNPKFKLGLGPLHTRAKSRDHEIGRAQKKAPKGRPDTPPKSCSVVTDRQV
jgi:hypothetical protein